MPKIDTYTANSKPAVPNQPLHFMETGESYAAPLVHQAEKLGTQWATIAGHLKAQSDDLTFMQMRADYEAGIATINLELPRDPEIIADPLRFPEEYAKRSNELQKHVLTNTKGASAEAQGMFNAYSQQQFPAEFVKARADGLRLMDAKLTGEFIAAKDRLSSEAGEAPTTDAFNAKVAEFTDLVNKSVDRKVLNAAQKEHELITFKQDVAEKNMRFIGDQDPAQMRKLAAEGQWKDLPADKKIQINEHVNTQQNVREQRQRADFTRIEKVYVDGIEARANFGLVTASELERGRKGLDPIHPDPKDWNRLADLNDKAPGLVASDKEHTAEAIRLTYRLKPAPTRDDSVAALNELDQLRQEGGHNAKTLKAISDAANEIQGDIRALDAATLAHERQIEATARAQRGEARSEQSFKDSQMSKKVHDALVDFDSQFKRSPLGGMVGKSREQKRLLMRSRLENLLRANPQMDNKEAVLQIMGTPAEQSQQAQPDNIDLLRKR